MICTDGGIAAPRIFQLTQSAAHLVRSDLILARLVKNEDESDFISKTKGEMAGRYYYIINLTFTIAHTKK